MTETKMVHIKPFSMRQITLAQFAGSEKQKQPYRAHNLAVNRFREEYLVNDPHKSISLLRQLLQEKINKEINSLLQNYYQQFFQPALSNIAHNLSNNSDFLQVIQVNHIFTDILNEAKKMYNDSSSVPIHNNDQEVTIEPQQSFFPRSRGRPSKKLKEMRVYKTKQKLQLKTKPKQVLSHIDLTAIKLNEELDLSKNDDRWGQRLSHNLAHQ